MFYIVLFSKSVTLLDGSPFSDHGIVPSLVRAEMRANEDDICVVGRSLTTGCETELVSVYE